jgi:hypothetical protein
MLTLMVFHAHATQDIQEIKIMDAHYAHQEHNGMELNALQLVLQALIHLILVQDTVQLDILSIVHQINVNQKLHHVVKILYGMEPYVFVLQVHIKLMEIVKFVNQEQHLMDKNV